jgi:hypothetical protein
MGMHASRSTTRLIELTASCPTVICHWSGAGLTGCLAQELAAAGFRPALASDAVAGGDLGFDVSVLERDQLDTQRLIDDVRRSFPTARMVSIVTIGAVTIVHAFVDVPRTSDLERLRALAAAVRRAARLAATGGDRLSA